jgi:MraZ protein
LLLGQHPSFLNEEYGLSFPSKFREILADSIYITKGFDRNLLILTTCAFETISQHISSLNIADPVARLLLRLIFGSACLVEIEATNQFYLPKNMVEFAGLKEKVVIVGQGDYCEIWSQEHWLEQESQLLNVDENAVRFSNLSVTTRQPVLLSIK